MSWRSLKSSFSSCHLHSSNLIEPSRNDIANHKFAEIQTDMNPYST